MWTKRSVIATGLILCATAPAWAQANLRPDTTPRLPPQPGQGLPLEDREFLTRAANLSTAEVQAGRLASEKASDPALKAAGGDLVTEHTRLLEQLREHAAHFQDPGAVAKPQPAGEADIQSFAGLSGDAFDREYLKWQLRTHLALVNLYQTQASHSPESDLAKFGITTLLDIQRSFDKYKEFGKRYDLKAETVGQPPQYGQPVR